VGAKKKEEGLISKQNKERRGESKRKKGFWLLHKEKETILERTPR